MNREDIATRLAQVSQRIAAAAQAAGRRPDEITLIGITKTHPVEVAELAYALGVADLGENRVADLVIKRRAVPNATWHMVGQLQRNKARDVVDGRTVIHSVDRRSLVDTVNRHAAEASVTQPVLVQVNVGDDPAKGGCPVADAHDLVAYAHDLRNLRVVGLMTMPPLPGPGAEAARAAAPHFATLRSLRDAVNERYPEVTELSMGMSADFAAAIAEGATMVRIGTELFGSRRTADGQTAKGAR